MTRISQALDCNGAFSFTSAQHFPSTDRYLHKMSVSPFHIGVIIDDFEYFVSDKGDEM